MAGREPAVTTLAEAERLAAAVEARTAALSDILGQETALLAAGRLRDGLALGSRKGEVAAEYLVALEAAKANVVALKRFAPGRLPGLKAAQEKLRTVAERNGAVLATAKIVSEGLIKGLADEVRQARAPSGYAPSARPPARPATGPLVFSARF